MIRFPIVTGLVFCSLTAGCSTTRSWDALAKRFNKSDAESDELVLEKESLSEGFLKSRGGLTSQGLKNPEGTNLAFARWKEDVGQYSEAKRRYHEVLTANPDCLAARLGIARIERDTGRFTQCREILMAARIQHPDEPSVLMELGQMYNDRDQWNDSIRSFTDALTLTPDDQTVRYELGLALANADRTEEAVPHLRFAVGESAAFYNIAFILHERGRSAEAVQWLERTMSTHPNNRTRRKADELLAELDSALPAARDDAEPASRIAASRRTPAARPQIFAASAPANTANGIQPDRRKRLQARPAVATRTYPTATEPVAYSGNSSSVVTYNGTPSGKTSPKQWSGPQNNQSQWRPPTQNQVQRVGYGQPNVGSPVTAPSAWHRR